MKNEKYENRVTTQETKVKHAMNSIDKDLKKMNKIRIESDILNFQFDRNFEEIKHQTKALQKKHTAIIQSDQTFKSNGQTLDERLASQIPTTDPIAAFDQLFNFKFSNRSKPFDTRETDDDIEFRRRHRIPAKVYEKSKVPYSKTQQYQIDYEALDRIDRGELNVFDDMSASAVLAADLEFVPAEIDELEGEVIETQTTMAIENALRNRLRERDDLMQTADCMKRYIQTGDIVQKMVIECRKLQKADILARKQYREDLIYEQAALHQWLENVQGLPEFRKRLMK